MAGINGQPAVEGYVCWSVPAGDAEGLILIDDSAWIHVRPAMEVGCDMT